MVDRTRHMHWHLTLDPPTPEQRLALDRAAADKERVKRIVLKLLHQEGDDDAGRPPKLYAFLSFTKQLNREHVFNQVLRCDGWQPVHFHQKAFDALVKSCSVPSGDFIRDDTLHRAAHSTTPNMDSCHNSTTMQKPSSSRQSQGSTTWQRNGL